MAEPFRAASAPFRLGVEDEVILVDSLLLEPEHESARVVAGGAWTHGRASAELEACVLELITPVCAHAGEAADVVASLRADARATGVVMLGSGLHPTAAFGDVRHSPGARYQRVGEEMRSLLCQAAFCGVHVHVGMPDADSAIRACNGLRRWLPVLVGLAANSPFRHGSDTGLASARTPLARALPRSGAPREFHDYADYEATVADICAAGELGGYTEIWWDVRPHPRLGTVEVRVMDAQTSVRDLAGLAALVHGLAVHEATGGVRPGPSPEALDESCFRAFRDGRHATIHDGRRMVTLRESAGRALRCARHALSAIGADAPLEEAERLIGEGNGADRQRDLFARGGLPALLNGLVAVTAGERVPPRRALSGAAERA